ncbi:hypothetical protein NIE88_07965 [Sporolactobacillus shoreicorticis]|uniref:Integral membrane protein n=1 Tax=Sporolactobacillus shoreicorticis TaxID=1923877 RepID=A0ABW5S5Y0_9BACL|nr:hypothetical protein [Sporolactobacillus shoreicorticis]MCO7125704.1 hypothetical protein [Sporolactobacillus shoreicorticis]
MARRKRAILDYCGSSSLNYHRPAVVAWWSAAFPGFGHTLLDMHVKGNVLFLFEIIINFNSKLNLAMVYSFIGDFKHATNVINTQWILIYIPFYFYCIWDSYRTAAKLNLLYTLTKDQPVEMNVLDLRSLETCFLDKRLPWVASVWSILLPGLGQLYTRRLIPAISLLAWSVAIYVNCHELQGMQLFIIDPAKVNESIQVIDAEWFLFIPSLIWGSAYDAYSKTVETNHLFEEELSTYLYREWGANQSRLNI